MICGRAVNAVPLRLYLVASETLENHARLFLMPSVKRGPDGSGAGVPIGILPIAKAASGMVYLVPQALGSALIGSLLNTKQ